MIQKDSSLAIDEELFSCTELEAYEPRLNLLVNHQKEKHSLVHKENVKTITIEGRMTVSF